MASAGLQQDVHQHCEHESWTEGQETGIKEWHRDSNHSPGGESHLQQAWGASSPLVVEVTSSSLGFLSLHHCHAPLQNHPISLALLEMISQLEVKEGHCPSSHSLSQERQLALHTGKSLAVPGTASQELSTAPDSSFRWRKRNTPTTKPNNLREQACAFIIEHNKRAHFCSETMEGGPQSLVSKIKVLSVQCTGSYKGSFLHFSHQGPHRVYFSTILPDTHTTPGSSGDEEL